jgi:DNA-binding response OmpR family regulator
MRLEGKQIYVADDDENVLEAITMILEEEGARVIGLPDGKKVFTSLSFGDADCILMDLYMPNSDGFDAIEGIKEFLSVSCPILVVTGHATEENIARAMELGATECIAKPLEADELVDTVVRLIDDSS